MSDNNRTITAKKESEIEESGDNAVNVDNIRKKAEYERFIELVKDGELPSTWELTAEALGVHPQTIQKWKKLPEFQEAKKRGIEEAIREMKEAGKNDWKMWRESLALLRNEGKSKGVRVSTDEMTVEFIEHES